MPLVCEWALLATTSEAIKNVNNKGNFLLTSLYLELTTASELSKAYDKIYNSIYWKESNTRTKKRVNETLNSMAFKIADHLEESIKLFNQICEQNQLENSTDSDLYYALANAKYKIGTVYKSVQAFIEPKQLKLL
jgi:sensor domain CHASE-containing protein